MDAPADSEDGGTPLSGFRPVFGKLSDDPVELPKSKGSESPAHTKGYTPRGLAKLERQGQVIRLRVAGWQYDEIAAHLGISKLMASGDVDRWIAAQKPSEEQTEELRLLMMSRLEELHATYWEPATNPKKMERSPDTAAKCAEILLKIQDRLAALMGVNLQPNTQTITVTAESVALFLGWDQSQVVDVEATEVKPAALLPPGSEGEEQARGGSGE